MPVVLLKSAAEPNAVLSLPIVFLKRAWSPNPVLAKAPDGPMTRVESVAVPPAVLLLPSVVVGLHAGELQTGVWPQLVVTFNKRKSPTARVKRDAIEFTEASIRRLLRRGTRCRP